jgi:hypothetical protein
MKMLKKIIREELENWIDDEINADIDPLTWLRIHFPDLTIGPGNKYFDKIWYTGKIPVMGQDSQLNLIFISHRYLWSKLSSEFLLDYLEIRDLIQVWLEEDYKLKGFTPIDNSVGRYPPLK